MTTTEPTTLTYEESRAEEQRIFREHCKALQALANAILAELNKLAGSNYAEQPREEEYHYPVFDAVDGDKRLSLCFAGYSAPRVLTNLGRRSNCDMPTRVHIGSHFPGGYDWYQSLPSDERALPSINVAISKGAARIAAEIVSRLLPGYLRLHGIVAAKLAKSDAYKNETLATLQRVAGLAGVNLDSRDMEQRQFSLGHSRLITARGIISAHGKDITIERLYDLTDEQVEAIFHVLRTVKGKPRESEE